MHVTSISVGRKYDYEKPEHERPFITTVNMADTFGNSSQVKLSEGAGNKILAVIEDELRGVVRGVAADIKAIDLSAPPITNILEAPKTEY